MRTEFAPSYPVSILIAGDPWHAESICRIFCDEVGFCVTVTRTEYVYTDGEEEGVIVGLINYPRFPSEPSQIEAKAIELGMKLREELEQDSFSVQTPTKTTWFSWRAADDAASGIETEGHDGETRHGAEHESPTAESGDAQKDTPQ